MRQASEQADVTKKISTLSKLGSHNLTSFGSVPVTDYKADS